MAGASDGVKRSSKGCGTAGIGSKPKLPTQTKKNLKGGHRQEGDTKGDKPIKHPHSRRMGSQTLDMETVKRSASHIIAINGGGGK